MLKRIYCDNYKCLVNFEFHPSPLQLFMGRNGAGKSTIFEILELLRDFAARGERCEDRLMGRTRTRWQESEVQTFELDVEGKEGSYTYQLVVSEWGPTAQLKVKRESVTFNQHSLFLFEDGTVHLHNDRYEEKVKFPLDFRRSALAIVESRPDNKKLTWFKNWLNAIYFAQIDPKRMSSKAEKEAANPAFDLANFADWYRHLRLEQGKAMEDLRSSLEEVISGFVSLDLKEAGLNTRVLQVSSRIDNKPVSFAFEELSDGQRALVGLYAIVHCAPTVFSLLCIDEPENFVALAEIQPWLSLLSDLEGSGVQVFLASHHPEFLNQLAPDHGVVLGRIDGRHTRPKPFESAQETSLTPSEIIARGWELV
jgi:predicted ATPase